MFNIKLAINYVLLCFEKHFNHLIQCVWRMVTRNTRGQRRGKQAVQRAVVVRQAMGSHPQPVVRTCRR
jgi:hypothetical protein